MTIAFYRSVFVTFFLYVVCRSNISFSLPSHTLSLPLTSGFMASFISLRDPNEEEKEPKPAHDDLEESYKTYKQLISTLPREKGWINEHIYQYQGFWFHPQVGVGVMAVQQHFEAKSTDVLLVTSPKSGTIWFKAILFAIMNRKCFDISNSNHPLLNNNPHKLIPFLELNLFSQPPIPDMEKLPSPRIFSSHIPFNLLPVSIRRSGCRIVYVCRNPKDVLVSLWKFMPNLIEEDLPPLSLQDAYDLFSKGVSGYGPFWDHVEGYKKASLEWPERVFFITYEGMKTEPLVNAKRLAEFLGCPFSKEEEDEGLVKGIVELCSFTNLKNLKVNKGATVLDTISNDVFFRQGEVGDWKNHLTTKMIEHLDQITKDKLGDLFDSNC